MDCTAIGSAAAVDMANAVGDGYNSFVYSFAKVDVLDVDWLNSSVGTMAINKIAEAKAAATAQGKQVIHFVSFGGEANTFKPGNTITWDSTNIGILAQNIVDFVEGFGADGIDFDIEAPLLLYTNTDEVGLTQVQFKDLCVAIKSINPSLILACAPQINASGYPPPYESAIIVTTGANEGYNACFSAGVFDYIFFQFYNSPPEQLETFIADIWQVLKEKTYLYAPETTKLVIGLPAASQAAGIGTPYWPQYSGQGAPWTSFTSLTTTEVLSTGKDGSGATPPFNITGIFNNIGSVASDPSFGGFMTWSLNVDYAAGMYSPGANYPTPAAHSDGEFGTVCKLFIDSLS